MLAGKDAASYIELLEEIEEKRADYLNFIDETFRAVDSALVSGDTAAFLACGDGFSDGIGREALPRSPELMSLRYIIAAVASESELKLPLFTGDIKDHRAMLDKYTRVTLLLRRIEFDIQPDADEALKELAEKRVSPYIISGALYSLTSRIGHREEVLLKLASDAISRGALTDAYAFLGAVQEPCGETLTLLEEISLLLHGGGMV